MRRLLFASATAIGVALIGGSLVGLAAEPACTPDNGGITLPQGFCAAVVADNVGRIRHLTVTSTGDVFAAIQDNARQPGSVLALRDTTGDGVLDRRETFANVGGTGIAFRDGYVYLAATTSVIRFRMKPGDIVPAGAVETVVSGLPRQNEHQDKGLAFDDQGGMYVNIGAPSNDCQPVDRRPGEKGQDPCPLLAEHGGIWKFDANRLGQTLADGHRYATGMRQMVGLQWHAGALWVVMHGRDSLNPFWPQYYTPEQSAVLPSETLLRVTDGDDFGWPYCMHDWQQRKLILNPEYGGDGKAVGRCADKKPPVGAYPGHWAPNDLTFYTAAAFPEKYRGGVFIAFHGSWNRAPLPQGGYNVVFQPMSGNVTNGPYEVFADGFAGQTPLRFPTAARYRPEGLAVGPDGSLYIAASAGTSTPEHSGRIWRVMYTGR